MPRHWVVIPAAGIGRRMAGDAPKQYLPLAGRTVIEWTLAPFLANADIAGVVISLVANDARFASLPVSRDARVHTVTGGAERADSVLRGVESLRVDDSDWVLVHDAARPCLHGHDLARLISELKNDDVGGLLAAPVADTLKSSQSANVHSTISRDALWRALTPQMFRLGLLRRALREAATAHKNITDESMAIELLGMQPRLIEGRADNIKITVPEDLSYAEFILQQRLAK